MVFVRKDEFVFFILLFLYLAMTNSAYATKEGALRRGYCGDGILNGNEECDGNDLNFTSCSALGGSEGVLRCQANCIYDISDCMSSDADLIYEIDRRLGGLAETCRCECGNTACRGGCLGLGREARGLCEFQCDNDCICNCEGKIGAHVEGCEFLCALSTDLDGAPQAECALQRCELLTSISPNIGSMVVAGGDPFLIPPIPVVPPIVPTCPISAEPIRGTSRPVRDGFCGDGIINGPNEDCDGLAISNISCSDYNGREGIVSCQPNCLYDISDCIRAANR
jgi:hypothetical protein